jgi:hypothetical protein
VDKKARLSRWIVEFMGIGWLMLLSACGGDGGTAPPTYTIGGTVAGLTAGSQIGLSDNGVDSATVTANGSFTFSKTLSSAATYAVTVSTPPPVKSVRSVRERGRWPRPTSRT